MFTPPNHENYPVFAFGNFKDMTVTDTGNYRCMLKEAALQLLQHALVYIQGEICNFCTQTSYVGVSSPGRVLCTDGVRRTKWGREGAC